MYIISKADEEITRLTNMLSIEISQKKQEKYGLKIQNLKSAQGFLKLEEEGIPFEVNNPQTAIKLLDSLSGILNANDITNRGLLEKLAQMRANITIGIRETSRKQVDNIRGEIVPGTEGNIFYRWASTCKFT